MMDAPVQDNQSMDVNLSQLRKMDIDDYVDILGVQKVAKGYRFEFFNHSIFFDGNNFIDLSGNTLQPAIIDVLCRYFLNAPTQPIESTGKLVTFREFSDAGPLFSGFTENTNKTIEQAFAHRLNLLRKKCDALFSIPVDDHSFDLNIRFKALPKVPVIFQFNDADEILPANSNFLFHDDAENYLDIKSLASICTYLTGILIQ